MKKTSHGCPCIILMYVLRIFCKLKSPLSTPKELFMKWFRPFLCLTLTKLLNTKKIQIHQIKFCIISVNFDNAKIIDHILKVFRPGLSILFVSTRILQYLFQLEYCNICVHEKMPHGSKMI